MKKLGLALLGLAFAGSMPALADNTDTATVNVTGAIVAPLTATVANGLTLPHIVKPKAELTAGGAPPSGGVNTTLAYTCNGAGVATIAYGAGANPFAGGTAAAATAAAGANLTLVGAANLGVTGQCARINVAGEANYSFLTVIGAPTGVTTGVAITATNCSATGSTVLTSGAASIYCGASISVGLTASAGNYNGTFPVTVTYD